MRDINQRTGEQTVTFTAYNTKGRAWMQNYYGTCTVAFSFHQQSDVVNFKKAVVADGLTLSAM